MDNNINDNEVLLRVEHLCQYFKINHKHTTKAVDDVSFDIKKGECFGDEFVLAVTKLKELF